MVLLLPSFTQPLLCHLARKPASSLGCRIGSRGEASPLFHRQHLSQPWAEPAYPSWPSLGSLPFNICCLHLSTPGTQSWARFCSAGSWSIYGLRGPVTVIIFSSCLCLTLPLPTLTPASSSQPGKIARGLLGLWAVLIIRQAQSSGWTIPCWSQPWWHHPHPCQVGPAPPVLAMLLALLGEAAVGCFDLLLARTLGKAFPGKASPVQVRKASLSPELSLDSVLISS